MSNDVVQVQIKGVFPSNAGCSIFLGNSGKVFVINVDPQIGDVIVRFMRGVAKERPLTHDLINSIFKGFDVNVERVVITHLKNGTYFARLLLRAKNEVVQKLVEIDARPSDCIALAVSHKRSIFISKELFDQVEDMSEVLERINENSGGEDAQA